jgi:hypothetical protein
MRRLGEQKVAHPLNMKIWKSKNLEKPLPVGSINGYEVIT